MDFQLAATDLGTVARVFIEARERESEAMVPDELARMVSLPLLQEALSSLVDALLQESLDLETVQANAPARREPELRLVDLLLGASHWESAVMAVW